MAFAIPSFSGVSQGNNEIDSNGKRQGYWVITGKMTQLTGYGPDTKVEEGEYKDNKKVGPWNMYWPNGNLKSEVNYKMGKPEGMYKVYYRNGQVQEVGSWMNEMNIGTFKRYYESGKVQQEFEFKDNGLRNGVQKYYYPNGQLELEAQFANGEEEGTITVYNEDGSLKEKKTMSNGQMQAGSLKKYTKKKTKAITPAKDAKPSKKTSDKTNKSYQFDPNGYNTLYNRSLQKTQVGLFKGGRLWEGKWYRYNDNGLLTKIEIYKEGKFVGNGVIEDDK